MKEKLGLIEADIIDIPILYKCDVPKKDAESLFPDMVSAGTPCSSSSCSGPNINSETFLAFL